MKEVKEEYLKDIKWESFPKVPIGGQSVTMVFFGTTLIHEPLGFSVSVNGSRSMIKNKTIALELLKKYIELNNL